MTGVLMADPVQLTNLPSKIDVQKAVHDYIRTLEPKLRALNKYACYP